MFTALDNSFVSVNFTIESTDGSYVFRFSGPNKNISGANVLHGTAQSYGVYLNGSLSYKWTIDYRYNTDVPQIIQLRMYSSQ